MWDTYSLLGKHQTWLKDTPLLVRRQPKQIRALVNDKGSLTAALGELSQGNFTVNLLRQKLSPPYFHEQIKLGRPLHKAAMIREVELLAKGVPVVYARSIVPLRLLNNGRTSLAKLGKTPLGHLLFKDGRIRVSKREFAFIDYHGQEILARRTPYEYQGSIILVAEFFLPELSELLL